MSIARPSTRTASARSFLRTATVLGVVGAALGVLAGLVELTVGPSIRTWIGDKHDTTRLGLTTIALSAVALASSLAVLKLAPSTASRRALLALGVLVPGVVCFTTVGRLWYAPGTLLVVSGVTMLVSLRQEAATIRASTARHWTVILTVVLGLMYVALGVTAQGARGALGIIGGAVAVALVTTRGRISRPVALAILVAAVTPFAVATWWSVVTPVIAILTVGIGACALSTPRCEPVDGAAFASADDRGGR